MKKHFILDTRRSCLTSQEIQQFKREITKQKSNSIFKDASTMELSQIGAKYMAADGFRLVERAIET